MEKNVKVQIKINKDYKRKERKLKYKKELYKRNYNNFSSYKK